MIWLLPGFVAFVLISLVVLAVRSHRPPPLGLVNGRLRPCPGPPNCVCTEDGTPLTFNDSPVQAWGRARQAVLNLGGRIQTETNGYLHATFTTHVFRFVDDVELRLDETARVIHIRSSARVGQRDFGVNLKRVAQFRKLTEI